MLGLALLAVFRAPIGALWMPAVASTELGYVLAILTFPAFVGGTSSRTDTALTVAGVIAVALLLSPLVRVRSVANSLGDELSRAFGGAAPNHTFKYLRLLAFSSPEVPRETLTYAERAGSVGRLDLYGGAIAGARRPLVVMIHGGSWSGGDRTQLPAIAQRLAHDGYAVASIDYRLAPEHPFPAAYDDVRAAVDWMRAHADELGIDPEAVVLYGRSAGAHLALLSAYRWHAPFVRAVVALYAPTDLRWSWAHPTNPLVLDTPATLSAFLGGPPDRSTELHARYEAASPLAWVDSGSPPTLLVHGGRDELVSPRQTERLHERLEAAHVPNLALRLPWATHGCEASLASPSGQLVEASVRHLLARYAPTYRGAGVD